MKIRSQKGAALVVVAVFLPVVIAGLGLVIDNGQAFDLKRRLQSAADAGAIAGAHALRTNARQDLQKIAIDGVSRNGFSAPDAKVAVFNPPKTGKQAGNTNYVEVLVEHEAPLYFMKPFYNKSYMVAARAISGVVPWSYCILVLDKTASGALAIQGNATVDASKCNVQVDSNSSSGASAGGNATFLSGGTRVVGGYSGAGFSPTPLTKQKYIADPLVALPEPPIDKCLHTSQVKVKSVVTLDPGTYCGGLLVSAGGTANLNPGIYVLKGGLTVQGGGTVNGKEVMIYNTTSPYDPIVISGGATVTLTPPATGTYKGIIFFTDRNITSGKVNILTSSSTSNFTGTIYFPSTGLKLQGGADLIGQKTLLIVNTLEMSGNITFEVLTAQDSVSEYTTDALLVY